MRKELFEVIYNLIKDGKLSPELAYELLEKLFKEDMKEDSTGTITYPYWWPWDWPHYPYYPYNPYNPVWYTTTTCSTGNQDFDSNSTYPVNETYNYCGKECHKGSTFTC